MRHPILANLILLISLLPLRADDKKTDLPELKVQRTEDFAVNGEGTAEAWKKAEWQLLRRKDGPLEYETRFKTIYSKKGIYFLMEGADRKVTSTIRKDNDHLWTEDVFEVFLWPDERDSLYFEYEISPTNFELPILVPNFDGKFLGWLPWMYDGDRKVKKATSAIGGELKSGAEVKGWRAEFMIPYALLEPLRNTPPKPGTKWRANFYRMDYDAKPVTRWNWSMIDEGFHEYKRFGTLVFD